VRLLDLFSGIGGFSLGLERSGLARTVAFCEIDPYCRAVIKKHWPDVPCYDNVKTLTGDTIRRDGIAVDAICGGFPCQDISVAGNRVGIEGARSGLWAEYARLIGEIRPKIAIVENVSGLLVRGLGRVLGDLATLGYDAVWDCIPASAVGAPHQRDRIWLIAYPAEVRDRAYNARTGERQISELGNGARAPDVADTDTGNGIRRRGPMQMGWQPFSEEAENDGFSGGTQWAIGPEVRRIAYGIPNRVDRLGSLGNAVVPQVAEVIGRAILAAKVPS
jgi:DNA (cytosine-5)-methyltransferase 1